LGSQHCCLGWADGDDSFYGKMFDVSYSTFLISFENQTQIDNLAERFWLYGKENPLVQGYIVLVM